MVFFKSVQVVSVGEFHVQELLCFADPDKLFYCLLDESAEHAELVQGTLDLRGGELGLGERFFGPVLLPLVFNLLDLGLDKSLLLMDLRLQQRNLLFHRVAALAQDLLERGPLALNDIDPQPIGRPLVALLLEQLLACATLIELGLPLVHDAFHFLNLSDEQGHVITFLQGEVLQLASRFLHFGLEFLHLNGQSSSELIQNLFVQLIVLIADFGLDGAI